MGPTTHPLRRPSAWRPAVSLGRWPAVLGVVLLLAGLAIGALVLTSDASEHRILLAAVSGGGLLAWSVVLLGMTARPPALAPSLVNAVAVTPRREPPPDQWVHLFRRTRTRRAFALGLLALGAYLLLITGGFGYLVAIGEESAGLLLLLVVPGVSGVGMVGVGIEELLARRRSGTFGLAPVGLALGRSGVTLLEPRRTRHIPWTLIRAVTPGTTPARGRGSSPHPFVRLAVARDAGRSPETVTLGLDPYLAPPAAVFSALLWAHEDEAFRAALGTAAAQDVLEAWVPGPGAPSADPSG